MLEDVVVAWTGSARSRAALAWALGRPGTRSVRLLRVLPDDEAGHDVAPGCRIAMEGEVARLRAEHGTMRITSAVEHGDAEEVLLAHAARCGVLALGTGGSAAVRLPHRSALLAAIARFAEGPVALVPADGGDPAGPVVAGVDGTAAGVAAVQVAAQEAAASDRSLVALHVRGASAAEGWPGGSLDAAAHDIGEHLPHLLVRQRTVRGDIRHEIRLAAASASLLVIGRHAASGPGAGIELDAVAGATCPVLLVRESDALWTAETSRLASAPSAR